MFENTITGMGEEQEDDSSSLKSTGYVFPLSQGLESTTPTQGLSLILLFGFAMFW